MIKQNETFTILFKKKISPCSYFRKWLVLWLIPHADRHWSGLHSLESRLSPPLSLSLPTLSPSLSHTQSDSPTYSLAVPSCSQLEQLRSHQSGSRGPKFGGPSADWGYWQPYRVQMSTWHKTPAIYGDWMCKRLLPAGFSIFARLTREGAARQTAK